jgi:peptidoglycan/xylan/chitin deacetylase (PgdA/CDA1 family)
MLPAREEIAKKTIANIEYDDIFVDHREDQRVEFYHEETNFPDVPDNLLYRCLKIFNFKPDFVLLDSAGHIGNIEFNCLIDNLHGPCYIALDDIYHIKHHHSFRQIQTDSRFELICHSKEKFGFCIAKFTPASVSATRKSNAPADTRSDTTANSGNSPAEIIEVTGRNSPQPTKERTRLKFMQIDTFYPRYTASLYARKTDLVKKSWREQMNEIFKDGFAAVHTLAPYMPQLGYDAQWVVANCAPLQIQWARENGISKFDKTSWMFDILKAQIETFKPDVIYTTDCTVFDGKFFNQLPRKPILLLGWQAADIPAAVDWSGFDAILSPLTSLREKTVQLGSKSAKHFLPGFPLWIFDEIKDANPVYDVGFAGQWTTSQHPKRNHYLTKIAEASKQHPQYSCRFYLSGEVDKIPPIVTEYNCGEIYGLEMHKALRLCRIGLDARGNIRHFKEGQTTDVAGEETANMRIFETTGCGIFLLTEYFKNLENYFEIGKEIETFKDEKELVEKIRFYLAHPELRTAIAERGQQRCLRDHSALERIKSLDNIIKELLSKQSDLTESIKPVKINLSAAAPDNDIASCKTNVPTADNDSVQPVSRLFGFDRGTPIDRYYIEKFLDSNRAFIHGRVLEIGDNAYTRKYGTNVTCSDVLNFNPSAGATIVGDLATGRNIPQESFDCIILTQTIQMIYDIKSALRNAVNALKPGGTLLITASGISQISRYDMDRWGEYWRFTDKSLKTLLAEVVPSKGICVEAHGNVAVAKAFLDGRALHELSQQVLDHQDNDYQVVLTARAHKVATPASTEPADNKTIKKQASFSTPLFLLYHRVADNPVDSQLLAVSPKNFEAHLKELTANYRVVPLSGLIEEIRQNKLEPDTVAITFDDGYADNLTNALPLLEKYNLPATIFVTSGIIGSDTEFWWDTMERIFLTNHSLPNVLKMNDSQQVLTWNLNTPQNRLKACDQLCSLLRDKPAEEINWIIEQLLTWAGLPAAASSDYLTLNTEQLIKLASSPLIEIGSHTVTHTKLSILPLQGQRNEICESKQQLESIIGKPVRLLSYPFGGVADFTKETAAMVAQTGYEAGIANIQGNIAAPTDLYAVPRRLVRNWTANVFAAWLRYEDKNSLEKETVSARAGRLLNYRKKPLKRLGEYLLGMEAAK